VEHPDRAVRGEFVEPILFLADRMAAQDPIQPPPAKSITERLAELLGLRGYREQASYRRLNDAVACDMLVTERARKGALVVASLVLKADTDGGENAKAYFSGLRERLGLEMIVVPTSIEEHLGLALEYLRD
jgi:hypothetical protein